MNWADYKYKHRGEVGVLLCTGPTLAEYRPIKGVLHFGVNSAIYAGIPLDYLAIQDPGHPSNPWSYVSRRPDYDHYRCRHAKFYGVSLSPLLKERASPARAEAYEFSSNPLIETDGHRVEDPDLKPYFSSNLEKHPPASAGSIAFPALQMMLWMGCREIIIVGADITDPRRFNDGDSGNDYARFHLPRWIQFASWASEVYDDVRISVLRPRGLRGIFPETVVRSETPEPAEPVKKRPMPSKWRPRLHMLCPPNTVADGSMPHCAFTAKVERIAPALASRGHDVVVYAHERSKIEGVEVVPCMNDKMLALAYGSKYVEGGWRTKIPKCNLGDPCHRAYCERAIAAIRERYSPRDFILCWYGHGNQHVAEEFEDAVVVEPSAGYFKTFADFVVYETNFLRAYVDGLNNRRARWYDAVIPSILDPGDFDYRAEKEGYLLYVGRLDKHKAPNIAIEAAERAGVSLVVAGQGRLEDVWPRKLPENVEFVGYVGKDERRRLLAGAGGVVIPSVFSEPNNFVAGEAAISGTPVICSNHSGLVDNVVHGVTGWRCSTLYEFVEAMKRVGEIDPAACARWGENYHVAKAAERYDEWLWQLRGVFSGNDWRGRDGSRSLGVASRIYP